MAECTKRERALLDMLRGSAAPRATPQMGYTNVVGLTFLDQWDAKKFVKIFEASDAAFEPAKAES